MSGILNRRAVVLAAAATPAIALAQAMAPPTLKQRFVFNVKVGPAQELGEVGGGRRRVIPILGGEVMGDLTGEVLPGGADWQTIRPDGLTLLTARYTIRLSDGTTVGVINSGMRRAAPDIVRRLTAGEMVDPSLYYFRTTPVFEVGPGPHQWLTENIFVATGERMPALVKITVFQSS